MTPRLGVRWTIGDVSARGFEALRLSVWGLWNIFGPSARYVICFNRVSLRQARQRVGEIPDEVAWRDVSNDVPDLIRSHLDAQMAEGVGWKFAPLRVFPDLRELALDNDCIIWELPAAIRLWLDDQRPKACVIAEDVRTCLGRFARFCSSEPRNSGIRGLSPGFDYERALRSILNEAPGLMTSELDEQGLQIAALSRFGAPRVVSVEEVTICSPFWPHLQELGRCGAHFVGLNARRIPWNYYDRPADDWMTEHWDRLHPELCRRTGASESRAISDAA